MPNIQNSRKETSSGIADEKPSLRKSVNDEYGTEVLSGDQGRFYLWSVLAQFNILYITTIWLLDRTNTLLTDVFHFDNTWESAPVFMLTFGSIVTILCFILLYEIARYRTDRPWIERIPPIRVNIDPRTRIGKIWRVICGFLTILFPLFAQIHFWRRLHEWQVWEDKPEKTIVGLWEYVPARFFLDWDAHRYGDYSNINAKNFGGVSFLPFWQPLLMGLLSIIVLATALRAAHALFKSGD